MEVNFRPIPPSNVARRAAPGQAPSSDEGEKFTEIIETLTAAENNPEPKEQRKNDKSKPQPKSDEFRASGEGANEEPPPAAEQTAPQQEPVNKKIGSHLDVLA